MFRLPLPSRCDAASRPRPSATRVTPEAGLPPPFPTRRASFSFSRLAAFGGRAMRLQNWPDDPDDSTAFGRVRIPVNAARRVPAARLSPLLHLLVWDLLSRMRTCDSVGFRASSGRRLSAEQQFARYADRTNSASCSRKKKKAGRVRGCLKFMERTSNLTNLHTVSLGHRTFGKGCSKEW